MKPTQFSTSRMILLILVSALTFGLVSWDNQRGQDRYQLPITDTVPKSKTEKKIRDLDDVLEELNSHDMEKIMGKAQEELAKALKEFDSDKIKLQIEQSLKDVDFEKIQKEIKESMAAIDFNDIREKINESMKEIDLDKLEIELKESFNKIDMDKLKLELEKIKEVDLGKMELDMEKMKIELSELGPKLKEEMKDAKVQMEKARADVKEYKVFVDGLDKSGLINKNSEYSIRHENQELFINGKKQGADVYNKYKDFLEKHKKFNIEKSADDFDLDMD